MLTLTPELRRSIITDIDLAISNLELAVHVAIYLREYQEKKLPPPSISILFQGDLGDQPLVGQRCGIFTSPVLLMVVLETRRALEFFKITTSRDRLADGLNGEKRYSDPYLAPITTKRNETDILCEDFGVPSPTLNQVTATADSVIAGRDSREVFLNVYQWANKKMMHFTSNSPELKFADIVCCCKAIREIYYVHLFDEMNIPRSPSLDKSDS